MEYLLHVKDGHAVYSQSEGHAFTVDDSEVYDLSDLPEEALAIVKSDPDKGLKYATQERRVTD